MATRSAVALGALSLATVAVLLPDAAHAIPTVSVPVNGTTYDVTYFAGSYTGNSDLFTSAEMPWYGNQSLAEAFASAVGVQLGLPNGDILGPYFAFTDSVNLYSYNSNSDPNVQLGGYDPSKAANYATATAQPSTSVPGPLPLMGATAAFCWTRKLRRRMADRPSSRTFRL